MSGWGCECYGYIFSRSRLSSYQLAVAVSGESGKEEKMEIRKAITAWDKYTAKLEEKKAEDERIAEEEAMQTYIDLELARDVIVVSDDEVAEPRPKRTKMDVEGRLVDSDEDAFEILPDIEFD